jgi:uncharacterized alpha/beta hydrolase family protein
MKKIFLSIYILLIVLFSCTSDNSCSKTDPAAQEKEVLTALEQFKKA